MDSKEHNMDAMIEVVSVDYNAEGNVNVVLKRGEEYASCEDIALWDEETADEVVFEEWQELAAMGEEGYRAWGG
jgi:hypothetical protein